MLLKSSCSLEIILKLKEPYFYNVAFDMPFFSLSVENVGISLIDIYITLQEEGTNVLLTSRVHHVLNTNRV